MIHLAAPALEPFCSLHVQVGPAIEVGATPAGLRRLVPILGGTVKGQGAHAFDGTVLPGGTDFQLHHTEAGQSTPTLAHLDARYTLQLSDGSKLYVQNTALRVAAPEVAAKLFRGEAIGSESVYFRCQPRFDTSAAQWAWLHRHQFVGTGQRLPDSVMLSFFVVR
jgi:hypothetical protein